MREDFLEHLLRVNKNLAEKRNLEALLQDLMITVVELVNAQRGSVLLMNTDGQAIPYVTHDPHNDEDEALYELSTSILNKTINSKEPVRVTDALSDPTYQKASSVKTYQIRSVICVPLISQEILVGLIYVENRSRANVFKESDVNTLQVFANQIAVLVHNAQLNDMLQKSREQLVIAREEERRRLRRELHDSLGPRLSGVILELGTAIAQIDNDSESATQKLIGAKSELKDSIEDIRQLARNLRPPALDDLGLIESIQEFLMRQVQANGLSGYIDIPENILPLSAALEVAIYRIVTEAITNAVKYSKASMISVSIEQKDHVLNLKIMDDGGGLPSDFKRGVGLISMQERAEELGGQLILESYSDRGTIIHAIFGRTGFRKSK